MAAKVEEPVVDFVFEDFLEGECPEEPEEEPVPESKYATITEDGFGFFLKKPEDEMADDMTKWETERAVKRYTLTNRNGVSIQMIDYGSTITSIMCPDNEGIVDDIVLGFETIDEYRSKKNMYFGGTIGRVAGIISNAEYYVRDKPVYLANNLCGHHLHGGFEGFDKVMWDSYSKDGRVFMSYLSEDGAEGYPGSIMVQICYYLTQTNYFVAEITAHPSRPTPLSVTNHSYFNLAGHRSGPEGLAEHCLVVNADKYVVTDLETHIATGQLKEVGGTYYDLRVPRSLAAVMEKAPGGGYDHTFCLNKSTNKWEPVFAARLVHPESGRYLEIITDYPGLHVYTADRLPNPDVPKAPGIYEPKYLDCDAWIKAKWPDPDAVKCPEPENSLYPAGSTPDSRSEDDLSDHSELYTSEEEEEGSDIERVTSSFWDLDERRSVEFEPPGEPLRPTACQQFLAKNVDDAESDSEEEEAPGWKFTGEIDGKMGSKYRDHCAICLRPQEYPDAVNHRRFPNPIVYPGKPYSRTIKYKIGLVKQRELWVPPPTPLDLGEEGEFDEEL